VRRAPRVLLLRMGGRFTSGVLFGPPWSAFLIELTQNKHHKGPCHMGFNFNIGSPKPIAAHTETIAKLEGEIARGVKDGTLTSAESKKLYTELAQLRTQLAQTNFTGGGFLGGAFSSMSQARLSEAEKKLGTSIDQARANGDVNGHRLRHSNIGVAAQQIQRLEKQLEDMQRQIRSDAFEYASKPIRR